MRKFWLLLIVPTAVVILMAGCTSSRTPHTQVQPAATTAPQEAAPKSAAVKDAPPNKSQQLGVDMVGVLAKNPSLKRGTSISVGTLDKTVILNGQVSTPAQKKLAVNLVKQRAPGFKVIDRLAVTAPKN